MIPARFDYDVAESVDHIATHLEQAVAAGKDLNAEIQKFLQAVIKESRWVVFNGDNYSEAWHAEAERRGLPNRRSTVDSLPDLISPKAVELFKCSEVPPRRRSKSPTRGTSQFVIAEGVAVIVSTGADWRNKRSVPRLMRPSPCCTTE